MKLIVGDHLQVFLSLAFYFFFFFTIQAHREAKESCYLHTHSKRAHIEQHETNSYVLRECKQWRKKSHFYKNLLTGFVCVFVCVCVCVCVCECEIWLQVREKDPNCPNFSLHTFSRSLWLSCQSYFLWRLSIHFIWVLKTATINCRPQEKNTLTFTLHTHTHVKCPN